MSLHCLCIWRKSLHLQVSAKVEKFPNFCTRFFRWLFEYPRNDYAYTCIILFIYISRSGIGGIIVSIMGDPHSVHVIEHPEEFHESDDGLTYQAVRLHVIMDI
jgi:hypothetical protein